jgi:hypothetical protein
MAQMSQQRKTPVTALSLPVTVRDEINLVALDLSAKIGKRISMAAVVGASVAVAKRHESELIAALSPEPTGDPQ